MIVMIGIAMELASSNYDTGSFTNRDSSSNRNTKSSSKGIAIATAITITVVIVRARSDGDRVLRVCTPQEDVLQPVSASALQCIDLPALLMALRCKCHCKQEAPDELLTSLLVEVPNMDVSQPHTDA